MGFYVDKFLPRILNRAMATKEFSKLRPKCLAGLGGTVLEIGFGSGLNLPFYPERVTRILALDPARLGRRLAQERLRETPIPVNFVGVTGETIPLDNESVDGVVTTWTLCTIPDVIQALGEMRRVLKEDGCFHFLEHGRSDDPRVARWQDRLNPIQNLVGGGCNINRKIDDLIRAAGFEITSIENFYMKGLRVGTYMYSGVARRTSS